MTDDGAPRRSETAWSRLVPAPRDEQLTAAARAEIHDPLWMLSRQWQLGEFRGEDAGSPVRVDVSVSHDELTRVEHAPGADRPSPGPRDYDGEPLAAVVEREPVATREEGPGLERAVEAGLYFLRVLRTEGYTDAGTAYAATDFPDRLVVDPVDEPLSPADRQFERVAGDRALDGAAVHAAAAAAVSAVDDGDDRPPWEQVAGDDLPLPADASWPPEASDGADGASVDEDRARAFWDALVAFDGWYRDRFAEPEAGESAWVPERVEYDVAVAVGAGDGERVLEAREHPGGRLDRDSFVPAPDRSLSDGAADPGDATTRVERTLLPTQVSFPGMPTGRWWEVEDAAVDLADVVAEGADLPRLLLAEFATQYGNDWFTVPLSTPVGTFARITDLTVTDSFGVSDVAVPTAERTGDDWNLFAVDAPAEGDAAGETSHGLFVPPVLGDSLSSDPVERVRLARDESANLAFGVEERVESPVGRPVERSELDEPALVVEAVADAADPAGEFVDLTNAGGADRDLSGVVVCRTADGTDRDVYAFDDVVLPAGATARVYTGQPAEPAGPDVPDVVRSCGLEDPLWADADAVSVYGTAGSGADPDATGSRRLVVRESLAGPADAAADYRLATDLPDHWFPFATGEDGTRLERALLLDASTLGVDPEHLPRPRGDVLAPDDRLLERGASTLRLHEEEVPPSGRTVTRRYRRARWHGGETYLWAGRRTRLGSGTVASGLRFDCLEDRPPSRRPESSPVDRLREEDGSAVERPFGDLVVAEFHPDPPSPDREHLTEEYVTFENAGGASLDLTGWTVEDRVGHEYAFPEGFEVGPGERVTLRTGRGTDTDTDLYWGYRRSVWNNDGDAVFVYDALGTLVVRDSY